ncbi:hypothetical protein GIB67_029246 [Kingdonia uniflora]|uniref:ubiquitinyl hydrolase 1 n=1 Tax=Kingdonia uniflora TaxID=39325 RepID=A0A7J7N8D0_9MAGN|nr:hypothetical protein GIB67_029246 [Kingdonia uniflora]
MADRDEDDLRMALRMSLNSPPEPKRSKPREFVVEESEEAKDRRLQRELMAAAAEKRMVLARDAAVKVERVVEVKSGSSKVSVTKGKEGKYLSVGEELAETDAKQLFSMVFGDGVTREILAQWSNQGIRFSSDPETCMGLVQHEGGPCGVLATIQAFVLKYLLFVPDELSKNTTTSPSQNMGQSGYFALGNWASLTEDGKARALVRSMIEILSTCGSKKRAVVVTLNVFSHLPDEGSEDGKSDERVAKALEGLSIESASDLQKVLRVNTFTSQMTISQHLKTMLPVFRSRMGAMLFLISALLSRGLESVQADRDDPSTPLVTAPFGHASQEIVNLLLCGQAVPNVFDGRMDFGGGMFLKGIPTSVEVGFLTLLESLNLCKVGQQLKHPKWPIWVVGSESHYTVIFAVNTDVQHENELEERESLIRRAFNDQDQSGGGGFISVEGLHQVLKETNINMPQEKLENLSNMGFIVWSEFWQTLLELDRSVGGMKDSTGMMGKKIFDLYHFNGIAKSVLSGNQVAGGGESPMQKPRISKMSVSVPPKWTPEEFMATGSSGEGSSNEVVEVSKPEPFQHAPLVDCVRTRWARAVCSWSGDPPSIV